MEMGHDHGEKSASKTVISPEAPQNNTIEIENIIKMSL